jgi:hypothetical protein
VRDVVVDVVTVDVVAVVVVAVVVELKLVVVELMVEVVVDTPILSVISSEDSRSAKAGVVAPTTYASKRKR